MEESVNGEDRPTTMVDIDLLDRAAGMLLCFVAMAERGEVPGHLAGAREVRDDVLAALHGAREAIK
jgi:hypothetical protein